MEYQPPFKTKYNMYEHRKLFIKWKKQVGKQNVEENSILMKNKIEKYICIEKKPGRLYVKFTFMGLCVILIFLKNWV